VHVEREPHRVDRALEQREEPVRPIDLEPAARSDSIADQVVVATEHVGGTRVAGRRHERSAVHEVRHHDRADDRRSW
jgi:hypothetical protein